MCVFCFFVGPFSAWEHETGFEAKASFLVFERLGSEPELLGTSGVLVAAVWLLALRTGLAVSELSKSAQ